jgi:polygalacturonase
MVLTRFEGMECMNFSPFIYALGQQNIAITGGGTLDGQADCEHWWPWSGKSRCGSPAGGPDQRKARAALMDLAERGVAVDKRVMGEGSYLRPMFVQPYRCTNVLIEGVTITNSPMYELHPVLSKNVIVRHVTVVSHGPNNDGCDPESCTDVLIDGCVFDTGDDCIAIKSGRNADGRRLHTPSENIVVQGCTMKDGHGGVTLGSECSGGIRNVYAQDCTMDNPNLDRVLRIKTNAIRGGVIENVYLRNVEAGQVAGAAIDIDFHYEEGENGTFLPVVRNIEVANLTCRKSKSALSLRGFQTAPIRNVRLRNCKFEQVEAADVVENVEELTMEGVTINGKPAVRGG